MRTKLGGWLCLMNHEHNGQSNEKYLPPMQEHEIKVLAAAANGLTIKETAMYFLISPGTVAKVRYDICLRLNAKNITHAVHRYLIQNGVDSLQMHEPGHLGHLRGKYFSKQN